MLSLVDEPLDLKISSNRERTCRTSICAPLRFARAQTTSRVMPNADSDQDVLLSSPSSTLDRSVSPSSPSSSPSSLHPCSPTSPSLGRDLEHFAYRDGGASPPPPLPPPPPPAPGFQFFLPIGAGARLRFSNSVSSGQRRERRDSPESVDEQLACRWLKCHLLFECLQDLVDHVTEFHVKPERRSGYCCHWEGCTRNGRGFNARYKMLIHIRTHTNEKPHQCPICSKSFSRLENLKIHTRSHTGEKPYACPYEGCGKRYSNSSDRFKHTRTHYEDRPYCCKMAGCHKRYTDPSSLRKHIKAHGHGVSREAPISPGTEPPASRAESELANLPVPRYTLPGPALEFLGARSLQAFARPLMALDAAPLDLSTPARFPATGAVLCHGLGALGVAGMPLVSPLLLPPFRLGVKNVMKVEEEEEDEEAERDNLSWVFVQPGTMMLKQAVVS